MQSAPKGKLAFILYWFGGFISNAKKESLILNSSLA